MVLSFRLYVCFLSRLYRALDERETDDRDGGSVIHSSDRIVG